jgi:steroid 5-alpha reductase family enzyme
MSFLQIYLLTGLVILLAMSALWLVSLLLKDASIVDIFWGTGFVITVWIYFVLTPRGFPPRKWLVSLLVTIWGLRLSLYILWRNWGKAEDFRYRKWRQEAEEQWWWRSYLNVFLLQGILLWIISIPLFAAQILGNPARLTPLDLTAILVWLIGFFFEAVGDWQLARFKADPTNQGKLMQSGLWHYTRHPNYFGDAAQWWGYFLVAAAAGAWWTIFSPILMTVLLLRVSGVTLLEKSLKDKKPGYQDYIELTSAFTPWFPKD